MVETWEELLTATGDVEIKEGAVFDFNALYPDGIPKINLPANSINANGAEFRNMFFKGDNSQLHIRSIKNAKFLNFYISNADAFDVDAFELCNLSGMINGGAVLAGSLKTLNRCSFNLDVSGGRLRASAWDYSKFDFNFCNFKMKGESSEILGNNLRFNNCKFINEIPFTFSAESLDTCVIDAYIRNHSGSTQFVSTIADDAKILTELSGAGLHRITASQMRDVNYLQSIGFPVIAG